MNPAKELRLREAIANAKNPSEELFAREALAKAIGQIKPRQKERQRINEILNKPIEEYYKEDVEQMPWYETALMGAGRTVGKLGAGLQDLYYRAMGDDVARKQMQEKQSDFDKYYNVAQEVAPWSTTLGEIAPYLLTTPFAGTAGSVVTRPLGMLKRPLARKLYYSPVAGAAAEGGLLGALHYNETAAEGALGGAAGAAIGKIGTRLAKKPLNIIFEPGQREAERIAREFQDYGYKLTPGQVYGSESMIGKERRIFSQKYIDKLNSDNTMTTNRLVAEAMGVPNADSINPIVMKTARRSTKDLYKEALKDVNADALEIDDAFSPFLENLDKRTSDIVNRHLFNIRKFTGLEFDEFGDIASAPDLTGEQLKEVRRMISKAIKREYNRGENYASDALTKMKNSLDNLLQDRMEEFQFQDLLQADKQYAVRKMMEKGKVLKGSDAQAASIGQKLANQYPGAYRYNELEGPMSVVGKFGDRYSGIKGMTPGLNIRARTPLGGGNVLEGLGNVAFYGTFSPFRKANEMLYRFNYGQGGRVLPEGFYQGAPQWLSRAGIGFGLSE